MSSRSKPRRLSRTPTSAPTGICPSPPATKEALFDLNPTFAQVSLGLDNAAQGLDDARGYRF